MRGHALVKAGSMCLAMVICLFFIQLASVPKAEALTIASGSFGTNFYEYVEVSDPFSGSNNSWSTASAAAAASIFNGVNGHLATITSPEENSYLIGLVSGNYTGFNGAWLGGKAPDGWLVGPEAGESFSYTNWAGSEPNNSGYAYMSIGTSFGAPGQWADDSTVGTGQGIPFNPNDPVIGYFVEYENAAINPVPEPGTLLLLSSGLVGLAGYGRRKEK